MKTKSQHISILYLMGIYGTHPELREFLHASQSGVMRRFAQCAPRHAAPRATAPR